MINPPAAWITGAAATADEPLATDILATATPDNQFHCSARTQGLDRRRVGSGGKNWRRCRGAGSHARCRAARLLKSEKNSQMINVLESNFRYEIQTAKI